MVNIEFVIILLIGLFAGGYGIIVGAGGGFILVPALLIIMDMPPEIAAGTGLVVVMVNALSGISSFIRDKRIEYFLSIFILIGALPGSFIGVRLAEILPAETFYAAFGVMLLVLSGFLFWKNSGKQGEGTGKEPVVLTTPVKISLVLVGIMMGIVSTFFGIGGGWLMVPILIYIYRVTPYRATATSIFSLCLYSIAGVMIHMSSGHVDWPVAIWGGIGAMLGAQVGVFISRRIPGKVTIQLLSVLLLVIGVKMLL